MAESSVSYCMISCDELADRLTHGHLLFLDKQPRWFEEVDLSDYVALTEDDAAQYDNDSRQSYLEADERMKGLCQLADDSGLAVAWSAQSGAEWSFPLSIRWRETRGRCPWQETGHQMHADVPEVNAVWRAVLLAFRSIQLMDSQHAMSKCGRRTSGSRLAPRQGYRRTEPARIRDGSTRAVAWEQDVADGAPSGVARRDCHLHQRVRGYLRTHFLPCRPWRR